MTKRDIFSEAHRRVPLEKRPRARPTPPDPPRSSPLGIPGGTPGTRDASIAATRYMAGVEAGSYFGALPRVLENARQLHEHKGPYYEKWRRAMRRAFTPRRRKGG